MKLPAQLDAVAAETAEVCLTTWPHPIPAEGTPITVTFRGRAMDFRVVRAVPDPPYELRLELEPMT